MFCSLARGVAAMLLLSAANGCSGGSDSGPDFGTNDPEVIVAMGDSITFGKHDGGVDSCAARYRETVGFCPRLEGLIGKTVVNEGECGATSEDGVDRVQDVLRDYQPGVLLILYSPNDIVNGSSTVIANLRTMIAAAVSNKTVPVVGTLTPATGDHEGWEPFIVSLNTQIRALCQELDVEYADHYEAFQADPGYAISPYALLWEDGLHPNGTGYELMAKTWNSALKRVY
jgi:lysophospholipase L1-like esterase